MEGHLRKQGIADDLRVTLVERRYFFLVFFVQCKINLDALFPFI